MTSHALTFVMMLACASASAAAPDAPAGAPRKYTPEIHGQLMSGKLPVASNVCLRQSGSEIRRCGYTDFSGHFNIPSSGPLHSVQPTADEKGVDAYPTYWLEIGRVTEARKLAEVEATVDKHASIDLDCDLARHGGNPDAPAFCERRSTAPAAQSRVSKAESTHRPAANPTHPTN
jgi:hypothetical protein